MGIDLLGRYPPVFIRGNFCDIWRSLCGKVVYFQRVKDAFYGRFLLKREKIKKKKTDGVAPFEFPTTPSSSCWILLTNNWLIRSFFQCLVSRVLKQFDCLRWSEMAAVQYYIIKYYYYLKWARSTLTSVLFVLNRSLQMNYKNVSSAFNRMQKEIHLWAGTTSAKVNSMSKTILCLWGAISRELHFQSVKILAKIQTLRFEF